MCNKTLVIQAYIICNYPNTFSNGLITTTQSDLAKKISTLHCDEL